MFAEELIKLLQKLLQGQFPKLLIIVGIVFLFVAGAGSIPKTQTVIPDDTGRIFLGVVGLILFVLGFARPRSITTSSSSAAEKPISIETNNDVCKDTHAISVFEHTQDPKFQKRFTKSASKASEVIMIGTGLAILEQNIISDLIDYTNRGNLQNLEIYLGNPYSHQVELRLWEEECGENTPLIPKEVLKQRIKTILHEIDRNAKNRNRISLRLFSNYPTFAMLKIDDSYFVYNYSFSELGTYSPVLEFDDSCQTLISFFDKHYHRLKESTVEAETVVKVYENTFTEREIRDLAAFAVYFIPDLESVEYTVGSEILGYDIRSRSPLKSPWEGWIGSAGEFGMHLTIADALYFFSKSEVRYFEVQIRDLCKKLGTFTLSYEVKAGFPDKNSISLVCSDSSGALQALHSELVTRFYTQAAGSNYTLKAAPTTRNYCIEQNRTELMLKLYKAPYVLECFKPHITLLTNVPVEKIEGVKAELAERFGRANPAQHIRVDKIAIMEMSNDSWVLKGEEIGLV